MFRLEQLCPATLQNGKTMTDTDNTYNPMTEKIAKAYVALGKLESIIYKEPTPKAEIKLSLYRSRTVFDALIAMQHSALDKVNIIDAHSAVDELQHLASKNTKDSFEKHGVDVFAEAIRIALPPKLVPTMANIEWDDEKHFLAEAEHPKCGKVIMLNSNHLHTFVIDTRDDVTKTIYVDSARLIPTGRRYSISD